MIPCSEEQYLHRRISKMYLFIHKVLWFHQWILWRVQGCIQIEVENSWCEMYGKNKNMFNNEMLKFLILFNIGLWYTDRLAYRRILQRPWSYPVLIRRPALNNKWNLKKYKKLKSEYSYKYYSWTTPMKKNASS